MKRISNFLFVEQAFSDTPETKQCVIDIDSIKYIQAQNINGKPRTVVNVDGNNILLAGEHEDNITDFAMCVTNYGNCDHNSTVDLDDNEETEENPIHVDVVNDWW